MLEYPTVSFASDEPTPYGADCMPLSINMKKPFFPGNMSIDMDSLLSLLSRPALNERSAAPFWSDEHISASMLSAHLDQSTDAASRRTDFIDSSVSWLAGLMSAGCSVIDLGCGPGLYASRLSKAGFRVTGIDISHRSIEYARAHDGLTEYIEASYLDMEYDALYDAAIMIYCDYAALTAPERHMLLCNVKRALRPGGLFIFDVFTLAHYGDKRECSSWDACKRGGFWSAKPHICLNATYLYGDNTVSADRYAVITDDGITDHIVWDTAFSPDTLARELNEGGFCVRGIYGDVSGAEYHDASETLCAVSQSAQACK